MIKKNLPKIILSSIITLIPVIIGLVLWEKLPEQIGMHWNAQGEIDSFASKGTAVFAMPLLMLAVHLICILATSLDPKNKNISGKPLTLVLWICPLLSLTCNSMVYMTALGYEISVNVIMPLLVGALFIVIGNYLPKCRQNYTLGIKLPWTLDNEENWNKTHRLAGFLWVIGGVLIMATSFLGSFLILFAVVILMVVVPIIYSYCLYKRNKTE